MTNSPSQGGKTRQIPPKLQGSFYGFAAHCPPHSGRPPCASPRFRVREAQSAPPLGVSIASAFMVSAGVVRTSGGGARSFLIGGVCTCALAWLVCVAWRPHRGPWLAPPRFCRGFLPFPPLRAHTRRARPTPPPPPHTHPPSTALGSYTAVSLADGPCGGRLGNVLLPKLFEVFSDAKNQAKSPVFDPITTP